MEGYSLKKPEYMKKRKRLGCGPGSGKGKTCGKGMNGQRCRSGSVRRPWFEGGQMPLQRRVPKRGFNNIFKKQFQIINVSDLERLGESNCDPQVFKDKGLIDKIEKRIKILGKGEITKAVKVTADVFSKSALEKIQKAGGEAIVREYPPQIEKKDKTQKIEKEKE